MEIELAPEVEQVVRDKVASGEYPTVAALVEEALYLLVERDWRAAQRDLRERAPALFEPPGEARDAGPSGAGP